MQVAYLINHPEYFPLVAQWNWDEWSHLLAERSAAEFEGWLRGSLRRDAVPTTLLAMEHGAVVGTVSVVDHDLELADDLSPWLASLYVAPSHRGRGLGRALVRAAIDEARRLGFKSLHLYTPGQHAYYRALGWKAVETLRYRGIPITVMFCDLQSASPQSSDQSEQSKAPTPGSV